MERYTRAMNNIERAADKLTHQKDKLLNPEKVKEEEEAKKNKSQSAELERQYLENLELEERKKDDESSSGRISKPVHRFTGEKQSEHEAETVRRISGTRTEDGIPAPEGKRCCAAQWLRSSSYRRCQRLFLAALSPLFPRPLLAEITA